MTPDRDLVVIIGTGGMGLAAARRLASGRHVILAENSEDRLAAAEDSLRSDGHSTVGHAVNVSDAASVHGLVDQVAAAGRVIAIVHTAGVSPARATARQIYEVDLLGTALVIEAFLAVASTGTSLVCVASMAGHLAELPPELERHLALAPCSELLSHESIDVESDDPAMAYIVAKRGNQLRVAAAAQAWGARGARLNSISPGVISTTMGQQELDSPMGAYMRTMIESSGAHRVGTAEDIAASVAFLASTESSFITGNDLLVDGGTVASVRWGGAAPG
jgi:NAD(P)-dependent dehydrogenase (short-subunit alcohol dehydrogenase family)